MRMRVAAVLMALGMSGAVVIPAQAGVTVYEDGDKKIEIGGRIQPFYVAVMPDCQAGASCLQDDSGATFDATVDDLVFRRLRPYIAGTVTKHWMGKIEFDFGEAEGSDELQIKDAFFARSGYTNKTSRLIIGNDKTVFSREFLNSSAALSVVERGFTGDHNFGVPDRALGVKWESQVRDGKVAYAANIGAQQHDPAINRMDFDSPLNNAADWNEGAVVAARVDFHPLGYFKMSQGDFEREASRVAFGLSAFGWKNDDDNNIYTDPATGLTTNTTKVDLDQAAGGEASFAYRGRGVTLDAVYQVVSADTVDGTFTGGLYRDGSTDLDKVELIGA
ncbi:MAG TPA: porin, partial [Candidatus Polarisedimenticolia bacterium]|nr:porin [Candidatus Polarisedimenticolia bacterium]